MGKGFGHDVPPRHLLDPVVTNGRRGVEAFFDIAAFEDAPLCGGMTPNTRETVGLQLHEYRELVGLTGTRALSLAHLVLYAEKRLDVVSDLVCDDVGLREVSRRAATSPELIEEAQIEIDLLVGRTVERSGRGSV